MYPRAKCEIDIYFVYSTKKQDPVLSSFTRSKLGEEPKIKKFGCEGFTLFAQDPR